MEIKTLLRANWDRSLAVILVLAGIVMLIIGWFDVSGTGLVAEQNPYLMSGGLGGIAMLIVGCTTWLSSDLQDEWRRLDAIEERLEKVAEAPLDHDNDATGELGVRGPSRTPRTRDAVAANGSASKRKASRTPRPRTQSSE